MDGAAPQLLGAARDDRIRLGRHDDVRHADVVEAAEAEPVAAPARDRLLAGLAHPDAVVGEDAVEVEDDEPDRPDSSSVGRVTGGGRRGRGRPLRQPAPREVVAHVAGEDRLLLGERARERPPDQVVERVGRQAAVGRRLRDEVTVGEHVAGRQRARGDELLPHLLQRLLLARERPLDAVADRDRDAPQVAHELAHALGHQGERVVGALRRVAEREVLLDHARAEHVRDQCHRDAVLVVGEADDDVGVPLADRS